TAQLVPVDVAVWVDRFKGTHAGDFDLMTSSDGTVNRYPILQTAGNTGSKVASNPLWPGGTPPANYRNAVLAATFALFGIARMIYAIVFEKGSLFKTQDASSGDNHKNELKGRYADTTRGAPAEAGAEKSKIEISKPVRTLHVRSLKRLAATCL
ncbi:hypothetical protein B4Q13_23230, partial [Lacticaseibacillus rhamnosus]